jgi:ABC-type lipoprotein export system ATPase subunit
MVSAIPGALELETSSAPVRIMAFTVSGGIFSGHHHILFPEPPDSGSGPLVLILSGKNGSGKTTILRMISGMLEMNFDVFRSVPFEFATLGLSDGNVLSVRRTSDPEFPLLIGFGSRSATLYKNRAEAEAHYLGKRGQEIEAVRNDALPILKKIDFEFLDIHRSLALKGPQELGEHLAYIGAQGRPRYCESASVERTTLANRVRNFMREAQVNYRKFFAADELELLPRIIERFNQTSKVSTKGELLARVRAVQARFGVMKRFGLQTDDADLIALVDLLSGPHADDSHALTLIETYVEMQESRNKARELIATRLLGFETIMDNFLSEKSVRIDARVGLQIETNVGATLKETELSSGEYHFLFMMVAALLCQRSGSIIAIDEPELSLHVSWQRKIVNALTKCAAGASPVFLFATHSAAIAAEHADKIYSLSPLE